MLLGFRSLQNFQAGHYTTSEEEKQQQQQEKEEEEELTATNTGITDLAWNNADKLERQDGSKVHTTTPIIKSVYYYAWWPNSSISNFRLF